MTTRKAFLEDAYLTAFEAKVVDLVEHDGTAKSGIILDATNFYATSGGQPGDTGHIELSNGDQIIITTTVYSKDRKTIVHVCETEQSTLQIGDSIVCHIDWERRHKLMQMHTACHLLSVVCPHPITSANVGENESRVDFDLQGASYSKEDVSDKIMALVNANHTIYTQWISENELLANPDIVKSKNVKPPLGVGDIRLVCIGDDATIDSQPCGGTHVSETQEVGEIYISKIENKGRENRRFRIKFKNQSE